MSDPSPPVSLFSSRGFDILIVSEARVARAAIRSLARVAKAGGYDTIFGPPPLRLPPLLSVLVGWRFSQSCLFPTQLCDLE